jgi:predicted transcriptional regulator of viral defense system
MGKSKEQAVIDLAKKLGTIRIKDLLDRGIHPEFARRLVRKDILIRSERGLYTLTESEITEHHDLALIAKRVPKGVICLPSALLFHEIGTQLPRKIWLAIEKGNATPHISFPPLSVVRFSGPSFFEGIAEYSLEGTLVRIYNPAKTVADIYKFRNKIGLDVAIEALKDCLRSRKATIDELWYYAKICRVEKIMQPYIEALSYREIA